jgi:hypothetical protein
MVFRRDCCPLTTLWNFFLEPSQRTLREGVPRIGLLLAQSWLPDVPQTAPLVPSDVLTSSTRSGNLLASWPMGVSIAARLGAQLACPAPLRDLEPCSERATRGYPALSCELDPSKRSKPVQLSLLQERRAKLARPTVQSERPRPPGWGVCVLRDACALLRKGLRAWRTLGVGQQRGVAECLADPRRGLAGLSLRASRDLSAVGCLCLTPVDGFCL